MPCFGNMHFMIGELQSQVHISSISLNYGHLKSTRTVYSKHFNSGNARKQVLCVWVCVKRENRWIHKWGWQQDVFLFSAAICTYNHIPRPYILKLWKCVLKMWLLQYTNWKVEVLGINHSTCPSDCVWYGVVLVLLMPSNLQTLATSRDSNCRCHRKFCR